MTETKFWPCHHVLKPIGKDNWFYQAYSKEAGRPIYDSEKVAMFSYQDAKAMMKERDRLKKLGEIE